MTGHMEVSDLEKKIIKRFKDFDPVHIFECGQCFRWVRQEDGSFTGVAGGKVLNVKKEGEDIIFSNTDEEEFQNFWRNYFDLDTDYGKIKEELRKNDSVMDEAVDFGQGIRILKQDPWEMLISFIISANNRIPMIMRGVKLLSEKYGEFICDFRGEKYYSFPAPEKFLSGEISDIRVSGIGFRDKYIYNTASKFVDEKIDLDLLRNKDFDDMKKGLMQFSGVGPKVSNCIALFSLDALDAFPVDTWVKKVMEYFYLHEDTDLKVIEDFSRKKFGKLSGYAQQYLFYYAREKKIGK